MHQPDNSKALYLVFTLLVFLCWSVACGDFRLLPLTVFVASLTIQAGKLGSYYTHGPPPRSVLFITDSNSPIPAGGRPIVRVSLHHVLPGIAGLGKPPPTAITVSSLP